MEHLTWNSDRIDREAWNAFVATNAADGGVLQSWEWGEFQESLGRKIWRLTAGENDMSAACLLVEQRLPFGLTYLYAPRGPVIGIDQKTLNIEQIILILKQFTRRQRGVFLRIEPPYEHFDMSTYRNVTPVQPKTTLRIDLTKSDNELLAAMHQKTRYNIRLAEKRGVSVQRTAYSVQESEQFWGLMQETARRDGFHIHTKKHYEQLLQLPCCLLFTVYRADQPLATAIVAFFGKTAYYLHGASANEHRDIMAPYALHWEIMREAKRRGCTTYDLWGVDGKKWPGLTRFKRGFAPETPLTEYPGTFDIPVRRGFYSLYRLCPPKFLHNNLARRLYRLFSAKT